MIKTLNKIQNVITRIKETEVSKGGNNDYSGYDYFTPEQIEELVSKECLTEKLFYKFDLIRNDLGIYGRLNVYDLEDEESDPVSYEMASDIPVIKATNVAQQLGGAMTYTKRYLLMNTFNITDNNLDHDTTQNTQKREEIQITWLTSDNFEAAMRSDVKGINATLEKYSSQTHKMKRDFKTKLEEQLNELI
jgi:hypothetical protein